MNLRELRHDHAALVQQARGIVDQAGSDNRDLTNEERERYDGLMEQIDARVADIERLERLEEQERRNRQPAQPAHRPNPAIGMSQGDLRAYSLTRAILAAATQDWRGAELEREASEAVSQRVGYAPKGFFVPFDWLTRDMQAGDPQYGGYLVDTKLLSSSFIELLRNRMVLRAAGVTMMGGLVGDIAVPKQTSGATAYWVGEGGAPSESTQVVGQVELKPKTVGAYTDYTRRLLKQSSLDVEAFVRGDLAAVIALAIDYAAFHGLGAANQPRGLQYVSGIGSVLGGTDGAAPDWADIVGLETEVAVDNADIGRLSYITNAKVRGKLKQTFRNGTYGEIPIWSGGNLPLNDYPAHVTNQVSSTLTKGSSSSVCSAIFYGNWADMVLGMWGELDILVDPYTGSTTGTVRVVAMQDVDVAVRRAQSFAAMLDALTA